MKVLVAKDYYDMSKIAAVIVKKCIQNKPTSVLGLPTGRTPEGMYECLVNMYKRGALDFSQVTTFNLDEYRGISPEHPNSYHYYMKHIFFNHINISMQNTHLPNGQAADIVQECQDYEGKIQKAGGMDLLVLGLGNNGHIGFNEPSESLNLHTHLTLLTEDTLRANAALFHSMDEVPKEAITMGMGTIMKANKILLLVSGTEKKDIFKKMITRKITTQIPASLLQLHKDVLVIADEASLEKNVVYTKEHTAFYKWV